MRYVIETAESFISRSYLDENVEGHKVLTVLEYTIAKGEYEQHERGFYHVLYITESEAKYVPIPRPVWYGVIRRITYVDGILSSTRTFQSKVPMTPKKSKALWEMKRACKARVMEDDFDSFLEVDFLKLTSQDFDEEARKVLKNSPGAVISFDLSVTPEEYFKFIKANNE